MPLCPSCTGPDALLPSSVLHPCLPPLLPGSSPDSPGTTWGAERGSALLTWPVGMLPASPWQPRAYGRARSPPDAFGHLLILALLGINVAGEEGNKHSSSPN